MLACLHSPGSCLPSFSVVSACFLVSTDVVSNFSLNYSHVVGNLIGMHFKCVGRSCVRPVNSSDGSHRCHARCSRNGRMPGSSFISKRLDKVYVSTVLLELLELVCPDAIVSVLIWCAIIWRSLATCMVMRTLLWSTLGKRATVAKLTETQKLTLPTGTHRMLTECVWRPKLRPPWQLRHKCRVKHLRKCHIPECATYIRNYHKGALMRRITRMRRRAATK